MCVLKDTIDTQGAKSGNVGWSPAGSQLFSSEVKNSVVIGRKKEIASLILSANYFSLYIKN